MLKQLSSLDKVHDKVDPEVLYENVVHGYDEWVVDLVQYLLL
jgi:hypothetical protein